MKSRLFVDMDGVLAVFQPVNTLETLYEEGYFLNLAPQQQVVDAIKLLTNDQDIEVYILSSHLSDSPYALAEKNAWLDAYLPEVPITHRIFPPCGVDKNRYVTNLCSSDFLLDDYTLNLLQWDPPGKGIKLLNGINHTHQTWQGDTISMLSPSYKIAQEIKKTMKSLTQKEGMSFSFFPKKRR